MRVVEKQIVEQLKHLRPDQQRQLLELAREFAEEKGRGLPGTALMEFGGLIGPEDLRDMQTAIDAGCETIDVDEW